MSNNFPPSVTIFDTNVQMGTTVPLANLFEVEDVDPNSTVERIRFRDSGTNPQTGFFSVNGVPQQAGTVIEIDIDDIGSVLYHAGVAITSEQISVEAFDGDFWSDPGIGTMFTVVANLNPPIADGTDFSIVATEIMDVAEFVDASDPDGYPILEYMFVNRSTDPNGGDLVFKGTVMPDAVWFSVDAEDLDDLQYRAALYGKSETISFIARDEAAWSAVADFSAQTLPNLFNPNIVAQQTQLLVGNQISLEEMFSFSDADGNTLKSVGFRDDGVEPGSGFFTKNGVALPADTWHWVNVTELDSVKYVSGNEPSLEQFRVQAHDGQRLSAISVNDVITGTAPSIVPDRKLTMLNTLEMRRLDEFFDLTSGVTPLGYEVIDRNPDINSAKIVVNGQVLDPNEVHFISRLDMDNTFIQGGFDDEGRSFDEVSIRADSGFAKSAWQSFSFSTDPVNKDALLDVGVWDYEGPTLDHTFGFPQIPPFYYCAQGFPECTDFFPMNDPPMRAAVRDILQTYENFFNITYTEVPSTEVPDISFAMSNSLAGSAKAYAYVPRGGVEGVKTFHGDVFYTESDPDRFNMDPGEFGYTVLIHENGHSVGLKHPFSDDPQLPPEMENHQFTVMSINSAFTDETGTTIYPATPMLYDVMAIQELYGANPNYRADNTQWKFDRDLTLPQTLYDAGGMDTFNLNNHFINATINLNEGQFSSVGGLENNVGIAWGTEVENARGGLGNDTIIGTDTNNLFFGNSGDDTLIGNGGPDHLFGQEGRDRYVYHIGDGLDFIDEKKGAGRDFIQIHLFDEYVDDSDPEDPLGGTTLFDNLQFRRNGLDMEVRLTLDSIAEAGGMTIHQMAYGRNRVETLQLFDSVGEQVGPDISLFSIFQFASSSFQSFEITNNTSKYGNLALPG